MNVTNLTLYEIYETMNSSIERILQILKDVLVRRQKPVYTMGTVFLHNQKLLRVNLFKKHLKLFLFYNKKDFLHRFGFITMILIS